MVGSVLAILAGVLLAGDALAQQPPALARRELSVTLTGNPAEPLPEIRAAPGVATLALFDAELDLDTLEVDGARIKLVGTGPRFILFTPVVRLGVNERVLLRVGYADGREPEQAVFAIVSHPMEVHTRIEVARREPPKADACEPQLAEARAQCSVHSPTRAARAGLWGDAGISSTRLPAPSGAESTSGLSYVGGWIYSTERWGLVKVEIRNAPGQPSWSPREATLKRGTGEVHVRVEAEPAEIAPGETGTVFVEYATPEDAERHGKLELRDGTGRAITVPEVRIPGALRLRKVAK
jgi:uncharacterized protein (TIGR02268 family)